MQKRPATLKFLKQNSEQFYIFDRPIPPKIGTPSLIGKRRFN